jgi:hypothetical protein
MGERRLVGLNGKWCVKEKGKVVLELGILKW